MCPLPGRHHPPGGVTASFGRSSASGLGSPGSQTASGNCPSHARCLDLWPGTNRVERRPLGHGSMEPFLMSERNDAPTPLIPLPRGPLPQVPPAPARPHFDIQIDGRTISVPEGATILDAARLLGINTPTLCYLENLTPVNVCRVCV